MKKHHFASPVIASSGMLGFFREGYAYHKYLKIFLFWLRYVTFQSKTTTAEGREGNLKLSKEDGITPIDFNPDCIYVNVWKGYAVNNVSLSGPGIKALLEKGLWQEMEGEVHISIMLVGKTPEERRKEAGIILFNLKPELSRFKAKKIYLHWNVSCPNTEHGGQNAFLLNFLPEYEILCRLQLPIIIKVAWNFPIETALRLQELTMIYGFDAINTIAFDDLPGYVKRKYFKKGPGGQYISPLDEFQDSFIVKGRGGVSGNPIRPFALKWIRDARAAGVTAPIIGGGGLLWPWHVLSFKKAGATAISPGSVSFLRPFNLLFIIIIAKLVFRKH